MKGVTMVFVGDDGAGSAMSEGRGVAQWWQKRLSG
jgi:hypothetical protein